MTPEESNLNAMPYDAPQDEWEHYEDDVDEPLPGRPRRRLFTRTSAALAAVLVGALAFYAGVRVEKGQMSSAQSAASTRAGAAATGSRATSGTSGAGARSASGGFSTGLFGGGQGSAALGTVSSVSGDTLYVTETSGNVLKVELSSATKVSKSVTVGKSAVRPGDTVVIRGLTSNGTVSATTVTDSGAGGGGFGAFGARGGSQGSGGSSGSGGSGGSSGSGTSGGSGSGSASSAVNSLFGSGGGGG